MGLKSNVKNRASSVRQYYSVINSIIIVSNIKVKARETLLE